MCTSEQWCDINRPALEKQKPLRKSNFLTPGLFHGKLCRHLLAADTLKHPAFPGIPTLFHTWISLSELLTEDILWRWHPISPCLSRLFQYRCERIPACNTLDPYLASPIWQRSIPLPLLAARDTPGLEGMRRYHWLSSEIWGKRGRRSPKHTPWFIPDFPARRDHLLCRRSEAGIVRTFAPRPTGTASSPVNQPRACVHESQRARNQLAPAPSQIVLTHSLLSTSDWQSL